LTVEIVVLDSDPAFGSIRDGRTIGEIEHSALTRLGNVRIFESTPSTHIIERARHANILLTNKVVLGEQELACLPELKMISVLATGVNVVDLQATRRRHVVVCNVPGYSTASTAQHAIALMLEIFNQAGAHARHVQAGGWQQSSAFSYFLEPLGELEGKTLGIVGLGAIGLRVGQIAHALGMNVVAHTRTRREQQAFPLVGLDDLLGQSDVVSLHCPLTPNTHHLIDSVNLSKMKRGAVLINVARGPIVDEEAVAAALHSGQLGALGTDVLTQEPPREASPLFSAPHCLVTPHLAWASIEARRRLLAATVANIEAFLAGTPHNVVN
jgi:glycerate dehydrogenase